MKASMKLALAALLCVAALPAGATEFGDRYPAGSIQDRAKAEQALREADAEAKRIERESAAREVECYKGFLVNQCRDKLRRDKLDAERELRRVRVEAHDLQRTLEAREAASKRAEAAARVERRA